MWATREALRVVAARGVKLETYPEAKSVLATPTWLACIAAASGIRFTEKGRRLLRASHFAQSAEEMSAFMLLEVGSCREFGCRF